MAALLLVLLVQITPFQLPDPSSGDGRRGGFASCIEPLDVCGGGAGPGGTLANHQWLPAPAVEPSRAPAPALPLAVAGALAAQAHPQPQLRPPRIAPSL